MKGFPLHSREEFEAGVMAAEEAYIDRKFDEWGARTPLVGQWARRPNLVREAFRAGFKAGVRDDGARK